MEVRKVGIIGGVGLEKRAEEKQLNPKAKEYEPLGPVVSLPPLPPQIHAAYVVWHGGRFLSPPSPSPSPFQQLVVRPSIIHNWWYSNSTITYAPPPVLSMPKPKPKPKPSFAEVEISPKSSFHPSNSKRRRSRATKMVVAHHLRSRSTAHNKPIPTHTPPPLGAVPSFLSNYPFGKSTTSLMIRNIPVRLRQGELMELLDGHCREENEKLLLSLSTATCQPPSSEFDFLYLPIDFKRKGNKGYAFVNFTSWEGAARLFNSWEGTNWLSTGHSTRKICRFSPALFQGREALKRNFQGSVFRCSSDDYLPVEIRPPRNGSNAHLTTLVTIGTRLHIS